MKGKDGKEVTVEEDGFVDEETDPYLEARERQSEQEAEQNKAAFLAKLQDEEWFKANENKYALFDKGVWLKSFHSDEDAVDWERKNLDFNNCYAMIVKVQKPSCF